MLEEIVPEIVQAMVDHKKAVKMSDIIDYTGFDEYEVSRSLHLLVQMGVVKSNGEKATTALYSLIKELKGIHLARAAQLGVNLSDFDNYFKIDKKEKKIALELASQADKIKTLDVRKRKPLLQKRSYFTSSKHDDVTENLMLLLEASNANLYDYLEKLSEKDEYLKILLSLHHQAESSWNDYIGDK